MNFHDAILHGDVTSVEKGLKGGFLRKKIDPNAPIAQRVPLYLAVELGHLEVVKRLLIYGANPNEGGTTPLFLAVENLNVEIVRLLLQNKADPNLVPVSCRCSPLLHAITGSHIPGPLTVANVSSELYARRHMVIALLLEFGADPNVGDIYISPLQASASRLYSAGSGGCSRNPDIMELILSKGVDVNGRDRDGKTALHHVAHDDYCEDTEKFIEILLGHGADTNIRDKNSDTPLDVAIDRRTAELLKKHMAKG